MKKKGFLAVIALAGISVFGFAGCEQKNLRSDLTGGTQTGLYEGTDSAEGMYGLGAMTTAVLLENVAKDADENGVAENHAGENAAGENAADGTQQTPSAEQTEADDFRKYLSMIEELFGEDPLTTKVESNVTTDAALSGYTYRMTVTGKDANGGDVVHVLYYNETLVASDSGKGDRCTCGDRGLCDDCEDRYDRDDRKDDDEIETFERYSVSGIMVTGNADHYYMEGYRTVETEQDGRESEQESELVIRAYENEDKTGRSVEMIYEQSSSSEGNENETERSYVYSIRDGNTLVERVKVEFSDETENGKRESEYEVDFLSGESRGKYEIERQIVNGRERLKVSYEIDGKRGAYYVTEQNGEYVFTFSDNTQKTYSGRCG